MAICGGRTWTLTVMKCSRDGLCSTPSDEIYPSLGVYREEHFPSPKSRGAFSLTASIECRTSPSAGWAFASSSRDKPGPWLRGPLPFDPQPAARPLLPVIGDPVGGRRRALGIVPPYPDTPLPP